MPWIDPGGPAAFVTALAFSADGKTLYAGGWDKVVRSWTLDRQGRFQPGQTFRVPIAPGLDGSINAIALSPDGAWLAAAGNGTTRNLAGFRQPGFLVPARGALDATMLRDRGTIYLFNLRDRSARILRGHQGHVVALTFAAASRKNARLLSVAREDRGKQKLLTARLWDVDEEKTLAHIERLPADEQDRPPGVALWQEGDDADALRAAFALHDGMLRLWKPPDKEVEVVQDLRFNLSLVPVGSQQLLTAGHNKARGQSQLALWQVRAAGEPRRIDAIGLPEGFPRALALLSRGAEGEADLAAAVLWKVGQKKQPHEYHLHIASLDREDRGAEVATRLLWKDPEARQPIVAGSLRGKHVAVAGSPDRAIRVYSLPSLLEGKAATPQILAGDGLVFQRASFVRRGKEWGLLLTPAQGRDRERDDLVFDVARRRLTDETADWEAARPEAEDWRVERTRLGENNTLLEIFHGEERIRAITLRYEVSDYALLPPRRPLQVPLLAVAGHERGQPHLAVYNARSGDQVRELTGHQDRLRSVAFSADGRLLVSTADDGMVCVWSLTTLPRVVDRQGGLPGVAVGAADGGVEVLEVGPDSPARDQLRRADLIRSLSARGKRWPTPSPRAFYEALFGLEPGTRVVLHRREGEDITLRVGQGIDEHKPLFSLFVSRANKVADREWIGWSPIGPYDSSSPRADRYLIWHFNTGDPQRPTRAAGADKYRQAHYREGLLGQLIRDGGPGKVGAITLLSPDLYLWAEQGQRVLPREGQAPVVLPLPRVTIKVALQGRPHSSMTRLTWRLDEGAETALDLDRPEASSFAVPLDLARGEHRFLVTAWTPGLPPEPTVAVLPLSYRPPPPQVRHRDAGKQLFVRKADFALQADVVPGVPGEDVHVTLRHRHGNKEVETITRTLPGGEARADGTFRFERPLRLRPGNNYVEVSAAGANVPRDGREVETSRLLLQIHYVQKASPPRITFRDVLPLSGGKTQQPLAVDPSRPLLLSTPDVLIGGGIRADEELAEAVRDRGSPASAVRLEGFQSGKQATLAFRERLSLEPGIQVIRFRARTASSDEAEHSLTLEYRPPVPVLAFTAPRPGQVFRGGEETLQVTVRGQLQLAPEARAYKVDLLVNGKPASEAPQIAAKTGELSAAVALRPGHNRIQARISNRWGGLAYSEELSLRYIRPPLVHRLKHTPLLGKPLLNLEAEVHSPVPLLRESVRVEVNGRKTAADQVRIVAGKQGLWTVYLDGTPLEAGRREQTIAIWVSNAEAACPAPGSLVVKSERVLSPPEVEILEPRRDTAVSRPRLSLRFQVRSAAALERVRLTHEGRPDQTVDVTKAVATPGGGYELLVEKEVELARGPNHFSVEAISASGRSPDAPSVVVTYFPPPLCLAIDQITLPRSSAHPLRPTRNERGEVVFSAAPSGQVLLHGRILWEGPAAEEEHLLLRVFVNGFQQLPVRVRRQAADERETHFEAPLLLSRSTGNQIQLVIPQLDDDEHAECRLRCDRPITGQRLHVLALGGQDTSERARSQILQAIGSWTVDEGMQAPAFAEVIPVAPQSPRTVDRHFLLGQLVLLREQIEDRQQRARTAREVPRNDVLMIYYQGKEVVNEQGSFFEADAALEGAKRLGMPCDDLVKLLSEIPGAHVLLLDVGRDGEPAVPRPRDKISRWKDHYPEAHTHVAVLRLVRGKAVKEPGKGQLLPVLQEVIPSSGRLREVVSLVGKAVATSTRPEPLLFTPYLPMELADLRVGPR